MRRLASTAPLPLFSKRPHLLRPVGVETSSSSLLTYSSSFSSSLRSHSQNVLPVRTFLSSIPLSRPFPSSHNLNSFPSSPSSAITFSPFLSSSAQLSFKQRPFSVSNKMQASKTTSQQEKEARLRRNVGIVAHVDGGKTTVSERMLFYSGKTKFMGEVHDGSTVMDFMEMERDRGITIGSAATSFEWNGHSFNLIDTPGHVDFSAEVERCMMVLDGCVVVVDGVAGVQAQTETVWRQTVRHSVPAVCFINKMDREGACLDSSVASIESRLSVLPLVCQVPLSGGGAGAASGGSALGHVDLITKEIVTFSGAKGEVVESCRVNIDEARSKFPFLAKVVDDNFVNDVNQRAENLVEQLVEIDDELAEAWWAAEEAGEEVTPEEIHNALRRATIQMKGVPVFCGSALKYVGIQTLLDSICRYLPSPLDRPPVVAHSVSFTQPPKTQYKKGKKERAGGAGAVSADVVLGEKFPVELSFVDAKKGGAGDTSLCALAFKVRQDSHKGLVVWLRVYRGSLKRNMEVWNTNQNTREKVSQLYKIDAETIEPVDSLEVGDIGAAVGLSTTSTGHTLWQYESGGKKEKNARIGQLCQPEFVPPVFMRTIETEGLADQQEMDKCLDILQLEDPTFHVKQNPETEEVIVCGLGELHLQIIEDRLKQLFTKPFRLGDVQVSYRQCLLGEKEEVNFSSELLVNGKKELCTIAMTLEPNENTLLSRSDELLSSTTEQNMFETTVPKLDPETLSSLQEGVLSALYNGKLGVPVINVKATLTDVSFSSPSPSPLLAFIAAEAALRNHFLENELQPLEPVMRVEIIVDEEYSSDVLSELTRSRRATIQEVRPLSTSSSSSSTPTKSSLMIEAVVPLKNMLGYSAVLRSIARGNCSFVMEFFGYDKVASLFD